MNLSVVIFKHYAWDSFARKISNSLSQTRCHYIGAVSISLNYLILIFCSIFTLPIKQDILKKLRKNEKTSWKNDSW